jgi:hypothetical protein
MNSSWMLITGLSCMGVTLALPGNPTATNVGYLIFASGRKKDPIYQSNASVFDIFRGTLTESLCTGCILLPDTKDHDICM